MPESRYVSASRIKPLILYFTVALVGLLVADALVQRFATSLAARTVVAVAWLVFLPLGGWLVWRRS